MQLEQPEQLAQQVLKEIVVQLERQVSQDKMVSRDRQVILDLQVRRDKRDREVSKVGPVHPDLLVLREKEDPRGRQV